MHTMSRVEKIKFIKEIAELEGGCIILNNKFYSPFKIHCILSSGMIKDEDVTSHKKYNMLMGDLPDEYINFVFNEIDNVRYSAETKYHEITSIVNSELGRIEFINKIPLTKGDYIGYTLNGLSVIKNVLEVELLRYNNDGAIIDSARLDIYYIDEYEDALEHIKEQIKYNKYL